MKVFLCVDLSLHLHPISQVDLTQVVLYNENYFFCVVIFRFWKTYLQIKTPFRVKLKCDL